MKPNSKQKRSIVRIFSFSIYLKACYVVLLAAGTLSAHAEKPFVGCAIDDNNGTPLNRYQSATFILNGSNCAAVDSWQTTCGTIIGTPGPDGFEVYFNHPTCTSAIITARTSSGTIIASKTVTIFSAQPLSGGTISNTSQSINHNTSPAQINCSAASFGTGSYSYLWQYSTDNSTFFSTGNTSQNFTPGTLTTTTYFRRTVTSGYQSAVSTNTATVTVYPQLVAGSVSPSSVTVNFNQGATLTALNVSGGNGTYSYQWQKSANGSSWSDINAATNSTYPTGNMNTTTYYRVVVTSNGVSVPGSSSVVTVQLSVGELSPPTQTILYNAYPGMFNDNIVGGDGTYSYVWQTSTDNVTWPPNLGGFPTATPVYNQPINLTSTRYYRLIVTSNGVSVISPAAAVYVLQTGSVGPSSSVNYGNSPGQLSLTGFSGGFGPKHLSVAEFAHKFF